VEAAPVLKVYVMTTITLRMKNLWGCYPDTMWYLHHKYLRRKLTLLTKGLNPKIALIDGTYSLNGHGPLYGEEVKADLVITANKPVVVDTFSAAPRGILVQIKR
jgi:uncharacterized protein (DUF362 family)